MGYHRKEIKRIRQARKIVKAQREATRSLLHEGLLYVTLHTATRQLVLPATCINEMSFEESFWSLLKRGKEEIAEVREQQQSNREIACENEQQQAGAAAQDGTEQ